MIDRLRLTCVYQQDVTTGGSGDMSSIYINKLLFEPF